MKTLFTFFICLIAYNGFSQFPFGPRGNMVAFVFANTNDATIGRSCASDYFNVTTLLPTIARAANLKLELHSFTGERFSVDELERVITDKKITAATTIFLYVSTHGGRLKTDTSQFPLINLPSNGKPYISSGNFHEMIKNRIQNQSMITIIDACNNEVDLPKGYIQLFTKNFTHDFSAVITNRQMAFYSRLFRFIKGDLIVTSSQKNVSSLGTDEGGLFTNCFLKSLVNFSKKKDETSWRDVLEYARKETLNETKKISTFDSSVTPHYPIWSQSLAPYRTYFGYARVNPDEPIKKIVCRSRTLTKEEQTQRHTTDTLLVLANLANHNYPGHMVFESVKEVKYYVLKRNTKDKKVYIETIINSNATQHINPGCIFCQEFTANEGYLVKAILVYKDGSTSEVDVMDY
jgi:hypothetical protein